MDPILNSNPDSNDRQVPITSHSNALHTSLEKCNIIIAYNSIQIIKKVTYNYVCYCHLNVW